MQQQSQFPIQEISEQDAIRRQVFDPARLSQDPRITGVHGYPTAFIFKEDENKRRLESVNAASLSLGNDTFQHGIKKQNDDRARLAEKGKLVVENQPTYAGYCEALVDLIRARSYVGRIVSEIRCIPGVFDVTHHPENGNSAHCHLELLPSFLEAIQEQGVIDGNVAATSQLDKKSGRVFAINMLCAVFELQPLCRCDIADISLLAT